MQKAWRRQAGIKALSGVSNSWHYDWTKSSGIRLFWIFPCFHANMSVSVIVSRHTYIMDFYVLGFYTNIYLDWRFNPVHIFVG